MKRNQVGDYMVKIFYPSIYFRLGENPDAPPSAGFPDNSLGKKLAESLKVGDRMIMYITEPEKRFVGLVEVIGSMRELKNSQWPYDVPIKIVIGPKDPGVTFEEAGIDWRPSVGNTLLSIDEDEWDRIIELLERQPDLSDDAIQQKRKDYKGIRRTEFIRNDN